MTQLTELSYRQGDRFAPIPPNERDLQTVEAELFCRIGDKPFSQHSEGLCFDRNGDLYYCIIGEGRIGKVDMKTGTSEEIYHNPSWHPTSVRIHKNGTLYISVINQDMNGGVWTMNPDGTGVKQLIQRRAIDDLIFTEDGGFYYVEVDGNHHDRKGRIWYCDHDQQTVHVKFWNFRGCNGIAINKVGTHLWVTEWAGGELHKLAVDPGPTVTQSSSVVYHFTGASGPDSCSIDDDDNVYVAMQGQGRVLIFNGNGMPIGQILLPGRDEGKNLCCSSVMVRPGCNEAYITTCDDTGAGPAIFRAGSFAPGNTKMFQFS